ncbi:hypothetical protein HYV72_00415 [Candidatus Uhrbacteria bacterium]|nr:hypothetical protein [Candidatus Uhrbacteria bacterium]
MATRAGALLPLPLRARIVVLDAGSEDYVSWDQKPHYNARWCVQARHAMQGAPVAYLDCLPRPEEGAVTFDAWTSPSPTVAALDDPREKTSTWFLSASLLDTVNACSPDRLFLLYLNRLGDGRMVQCKDCGRSVDCVMCGRPLRPHKQTLMCGSCATSVTPLLQCAQCGSTRLSTRGLGADAVVKALEHACRKPVLHVHAGDAIPPCGIVLVTRTLLSHWPHTAMLGGIGVVAAEQEFVHHHFRSLEQARRTLRILASAAADAHVPCVIQTWHRELVPSSFGRATSPVKEETIAKKRYVR